MKKLEVTNLNMKNLSMFLDKADSGDSSHYFELNNGNFYTKAHPDDKAYIKYTSCPFADIGVLSKEPTNLIKIPFRKLDRLKPVLNRYMAMGINEAKLKITLKEDEETEGAFVADKLTFSDPKLTVNIRPNEPAFTNYYPEAKWKQLSDFTDNIFKIDINAEDITNIKELIKIEMAADSKGKKITSCSLTYDPVDKQVSMSSKTSDAWNFPIETNVHSDYTKKVDVTVNTAILAYLDAPLYEVYLCRKGQIDVLIFVENESNILITGVITHESEA